MQLTPYRIRHSKKNQLKSKVLFLIISFLFVFTNSVHAINLPIYSKDDFKQLKVSTNTAEGDDCIVKFLTDKNGNTFVLKQVKDQSAEEQVKVVFEYIAAAIATQANIPIPQTYLIPKEWQHAAKKYPNRVAILQAMVPGLNLNGQSGLTLHQQSRSPYTNATMTARFGELKEENKGLTLSVIKSMSQHEDLCKIVAFDTFLNNSDRSGPNLFYDNKTNRYYGIDHLAAFTNQSLSKHALRQLSSHRKALTPAELSTLKNYLSVLKVLYKNNLPADVTSEIKSQVKALFPEYSNNPEIVDMLSGYDSFIAKNYADTKLLIDYTAKLVN